MADHSDTIHMLDELRNAVGKDQERFGRLRSQTIEALSGLAKRDVDFLMRLLQQEYDRARTDKRSLLVCEAIGEVFAKCGEPKAAPLLGAMLVDPTTEGIREDLAELLGEIDDAAAVPFLIQALSDKEEWVRAKVATSLGVIGDSRAVAPLKALLKDESPLVREYVIEALMQLKAMDLADDLIDILEHDPDVYVRSVAAYGLGELRVKKAEEILEKIINDDSMEDDLVSEARRALNKIQLSTE